MNLHNHTQYSDGWHTPEEVVQRAWQGGLRQVAITDHLMTDKVPKPLTLDGFERYHRNLLALKEMYAGRMQVLAGVEIDSNPERCDLEGLPFDLINRLDLVLFEYVNDDWNGGSRIFELDRLLSKLVVPCGLCHTDLEKVFGGISPSDLANLLQSYNLFVEANTAVLYQRDGRQFYEHAERHFRAFKGKVKVSVGTDAHRTLTEVSNVDRGYDFLKRTELLDDLLVRK